MPLLDMLHHGPSTPGGQDKHKHFRLNAALKCAMIGMQERQASKQASKQERALDGQNWGNP